MWKYVLVGLPAAIASDDFTAGSNADLHARIATAGGTWTSFGTTADADFSVVAASDVVTRAAINDVGGRIATLPVSHTAAVAQVDVKTGAYGPAQSLLARYVSYQDTLSLDWASDGSSGDVRLWKYIGGVGSVIGSASPSTPSLNTFYTLKLIVHEDGDWEMWYGLTSGALSMIDSGNDADLATGGELESGLGGLADINTSAVSATRTYDNFSYQGIDSAGNLRTGGVIGGIENAYQRRLSLAKSGMETAGVQLRLDDPMATAITDRDGDVMLKVYQDSTLRFVGDLTTAEEVGDGNRQSLACTFAGPLWRLQKRLVGKSTTGATFTDTARGTVLTSLLTTLNTESDTGVQAGTIDSLPKVTAGPWYFKPYGELLQEFSSSQVFPWELMTSYTVLDAFDHNHGAALAGTTAVPGPGGAWSVAVPGIDWLVDGVGSNAVVRTFTGDAAWAGAYGWLTTSITGAVYVHTNFAVSVLATAGRYGVMARVQNQSNWVMASINTVPVGGALEIHKNVAGVVTQIGSMPVPTALFDSAWYQIRLQIDASGNWGAWFFTLDSQPGAPVLTGTDADFETGGALANGKVGMYDENTSGATSSRIYTPFLAGVPVFEMRLYGLDYQLAPIEPAGTPVKIANLNVEEVIGTSKPHAVFEYGGGNLGIKSYRRIISRDTLLTQGHSLPSDFPTGTDIKTAKDDAAIGARGLFEEVVPSDVEASLLRAALIEEHVRVRKVPKQEFTFEPAAPAPVFGTDYSIGDTVTARVTFGGTSRFNGLVRVHGLEITIDENGKVTEIPRLVAE